MTILSTAAPVSPAQDDIDFSAGIADAARLLLPDLARGSSIDAAILRAAMETAFGGSDAAGAWNWKAAYDACEAATACFCANRTCHPRQRPRRRPPCCRHWRRSRACSRPIRATSPREDREVEPWQHQS
jgi:hypothetical protein